MTRTLTSTMGITVSGQLGQSFGEYFPILYLVISCREFKKNTAAATEKLCVVPKMSHRFIILRHVKCASNLSL